MEPIMSCHRICGGACLVALGLFAGSSVRGAENEVRTLVASASYPEGPCWIKDKLYYVEYGGDRVMVLDGKTPREVWKKEGSGPAAILSLGDGEVLVACYDNDTLVRLKLDGTVLETIDLKDAKGPNDFALDNRGGVYFSTSGTFDDTKEGRQKNGKVYYLPRGEKTPRLVAEGIHYANGLAITDKGNTLLVAEHLQGQILKYPIDKETGNLGKGAIWKALADIKPNPDGKKRPWFLGPDGLKVDSNGRTYICQFGAGRILITKPDGTLAHTVTVPDRYVTNVAFSPDEKTLYVTAARNFEDKPYPGSVYAIPNP
jgi:gluconolactonase